MCVCISFPNELAQTDLGIYIVGAPCAILAVSCGSNMCGKSGLSRMQGSLS